MTTVGRIPVLFLTTWMVLSTMMVHGCTKGGDVIEEKEPSNFYVTFPDAPKDLELCQYDLTGACVRCFKEGVEVYTGKMAEADAKCHWSEILEPEAIN